MGEADEGKTPSPLQVWVGWFHSKAGHNLECQLSKGAMYGEGIGRCIGEAVENLWAYLKTLAKVLRYMGTIHWHDALDDALEHFSQEKIANMPSLIVKVC